MSSFGSFLTSIFGRRQIESAPSLALALSPGPLEVVNDAQAYNVTIESATVTPGGWYWQVIRVHHLTPEENNGNHHIYLDILDPSLAKDANLQNSRVSGARVKVAWDEGEQIVTVDKPATESGASFPMWRWQICTVEALGLPGQEMPSDRVVGLQTGHPDEAPGSTLFHHSFSVTFLKVQAADVVYRDSVIYGVISGAAGRSVALLCGGEPLTRQALPGDGVFRFTDLGAGEYVVMVENTQFRSAPIKLDGRNQVHLDLALVLAESTITGRVSRGAGRKLNLLHDGAEVASTVVGPDEIYRFAGLGAGAHQVRLVGTRVLSEPIILDGVNAAATDLVAPVEGKALSLYVLFGPAGQPTTRANLLLAQDYLLAFRPSFGFSAAEASNAGMIVIVSGTDAVSAELEVGLKAGGAVVQRIAGTPTEVAAALATRISSGRPF